MAKRGKQARVLSEAELKRAFNQVNGNRYAKRDRCMLALSFFAGLRSCELAAITWGDLVDTGGEIKREVYLTPDKTKGKDGNTVTLGKRAIKEIGTFYESLTVTPAPGEPVFKSQRTHGHFSSRTIRQVLSIIYQNAGLDGASSHSGRRTYITNLSRNGIETRVIQELARHKHLNTTQAYIEVGADRKQSAADTI